MPFDKALYPKCDTEGPFGVPMPDSVAKYVQTLLDANPGRDKEMVKLAGAAEVEVDSDRTEISKITTENVDRDKEVIIAKGIDLKSFNDNPVVLLNHDWYSPPIGKSLWAKKTNDAGIPGIKAKTLYATRPAEASGEWVPDSVLALIKQGMMPGKSIGFIPLERRTPEKADLSANPHWKDARSIITKAALLEYSVVTIPSNAEALCETVWKNFPGLAAMLPDLPKPAETKIINPDELSTEQLLAELARLKSEWEEMRPIIDRVTQLESERERLDRAVRRLRKDAIRRPRKAHKPEEPKPITLADIGTAFRKIISAA